ncbi:hypothetical protein AB0C34_18015 [Nocardia sp. NPDC049220]|uniref:hypothetical protein n=1 Tax=Nocardia sp. NPDC049220 TaxID=3155273 RepID=UPI003405B6ED
MPDDTASPSPAGELAAATIDETSKTLTRWQGFNPAGVGVRDRIQAILQRWRAQNPGVDSPPRSVRHQIKRELRRYHRAQAVDRADARSYIEARVRHFHNKVRDARNFERDQLHINAVIEGATPEVAPRIKVPAHLREEREAIAADIRSIHSLSKEDRTQALIAVYTDSPAIPVFRADLKLRMDVLRYHLDGLGQKMGHGWSQVHTTAVDLAARAAGKRTDNAHAPAAVTAQATAPNKQPLPVDPAATKARAEALIEWLGRLPERVENEPFTSRIVDALNQHIDGIDAEMADRALLITAAIVKDARQDLRFGSDPKALMMLDDEAFADWVDYQSNPPEGSSSNQNDLEAAMLAQPRRMSAAGPDAQIDEAVPDCDPVPAVEPAVEAGV